MLTVRAANAASEAISDLLNNGFLRIYGSERPASVSVPVADGDLLAELRFGDPAFSEAQEGIAKAKSIEDSVGLASGLARWYRVFDKNGRSIADGAVIQGTLGEPNCLVLNHTEIEPGDEIAIDEFAMSASTGE